MKLDASNLLSEEDFWEIIADSNEGDGTLRTQEKLLKAAFEKLSKEELIGFHYLYFKFSTQSYSGDLWLVPTIILGGCSDDWFDYFRDWLISRGKEVYYKALDNPDNLCDDFDSIPEGEEPTFEGMGYVLQTVFEEKFGMEIYDAEELYDFEAVFNRKKVIFRWSPEDEESMKKICPKTFAKWWDNDRF